MGSIRETELTTCMETSAETQQVQVCVGPTPPMLKLSPSVTLLTIHSLLVVFRSVSGTRSATLKMESTTVGTNRLSMPQREVSSSQPSSTALASPGMMIYPPLILEPTLM